MATPVAPDRAGGRARTHREAGAGAPAGGRSRAWRESARRAPWSTSWVRDLAVLGARVIPVRLDDLPAGAGAEAIAGEAGMSSPEALALATTGERILVLLDGCHDVLAGAVDLAQRFCEATDSVAAVLTTSRQPLGVAGERVVVLDPLEVPRPRRPDRKTAPAVAVFFELVT